MTAKIMDIKAAPIPFQTARSVETEATVEELKAKLTEVKQQLFLARVAVEGLAETDPRKAVVDLYTTVGKILSGDPEALPEDLVAGRSAEVLLAVYDLKNNYDELWRSFELAQSLPEPLAPTPRSLEDTIVELGLSYPVGKLILLAESYDKSPAREQKDLCKKMEECLRVLQRSPTAR